MLGVSRRRAGLRAAPQNSAAGVAAPSPPQYGIPDPCTTCRGRDLIYRAKGKRIIIVAAVVITAVVVVSVILLRAHEAVLDVVCRLLLEKKNC